jgi:hypothetical protein
MRSKRVLAGALGAGALWAAAATAAWGQANNCMYNGREYPEGVIICQSGLRNLCMNGEWQTKEFCSGVPDGQVIGGGPGGVPAVIEVPVPVPAAEADDD